MVFSSSASRQSAVMASVLTLEVSPGVGSGSGFGSGSGVGTTGVSGRGASSPQAVSPTDNPAATARQSRIYRSLCVLINVNRGGVKPGLRHHRAVVSLSWLVRCYLLLLHILTRIRRESTQKNSYRQGFRGIFKAPPSTPSTLRADPLFYPLSRLFCQKIGPGFSGDQGKALTLSPNSLYYGEKSTLEK